MLMLMLMLMLVLMLMLMLMLMLVLMLMLMLVLMLVGMNQWMRVMNTSVLFIVYILRSTCTCIWKGVWSE